MMRTIRLNSYPTAARANEEVRALIVAFQGHYLTQKPGFSVAAIPFHGEFHVQITADVETSTDGFLSLIIARQLAKHCRIPAPAARVASRPAAPAISPPAQSPRRFPLNPPRFPRLLSR